MSRREGRMTRAEKQALVDLDAVFRPAATLRHSERALDGLVARGLVENLLECGVMTYRISDAGALRAAEMKETFKALRAEKAPLTAGDQK